MVFDPKVYRNIKDGIGSPSDDRATSSTDDNTVVALLKGIWHLINGGVVVTGGATATNQTTIIGHVDGIETAVASTNTKLDTAIGHVDGVETAIASTNTKLDTANTSLSVLDDWDETDRAKVNPIAGQAGVAAGAGTVSALTQRVVQAGAATGTQSNVASSASDVTILAANTARAGASVYNDSTAVLYLLLSNATSSATVHTVQLNSGDYFEVPSNYNGVLKGIWASATGSARVTEWT